MRRPLLALLTLLLALASSLVALEAATAAPPTARPKPIPTTKVISAPIDIWKAAAAQTPGGPLDYCAVTAFVVFPEIAGFEAQRADYVVTFGATQSSTSDVFPDPPYDDAFTWGPLSRSAPAGRHQVALGDQPWVWSAGSADCESPYASAVAAYPDTAQVTYEATDRCHAAIDSYNAALKALKQAKRQRARATTPAAKARAAAKVRAAKAKKSRAKKKYKTRC